MTDKKHSKIPPNFRHSLNAFVSVIGYDVQENQTICTVCPEDEIRDIVLDLFRAHASTVEIKTFPVISGNQFKLAYKRANLALLQADMQREHRPASTPIDQAERDTRDNFYFGNDTGKAFR